LEFELDTEEAIIYREDDRLVIEPVRRKGLLATLTTLHDLEEEFPDVDSGLGALDDLRL
jgi:antitoxin VapB